MSENRFQVRPFDEAAFKATVDRIARERGVPTPELPEAPELPELAELTDADESVVAEFRKG